MMKRFMGMIHSASSPPKENGHAVVDAPPPEDTYEDAIRTLNSLQSNAATLASIRNSPDHVRRYSNSLQQTTAALLLSGLTLHDLASLPIIHVGGTKGKGTTCAFTERLLREAGLRTAFFSSPHLTSVRERLRINGRPITKADFTRAFFRLYRRLEPLCHPSSDSPCEMPAYFRFLTLLAFHVAIETRVDVLILEVGIGGTHDSTNIIPRPTVVGITALGLEHQSILGKTLEEIAAKKAGIMKKDCPVFTVDSHPPPILELLQRHAQEIECPLTVVPTLPSPLPFPLGVDDGGAGVCRANAALAIHLANEFLLQRHAHIFPNLSMDMKCSAELPYSQDPAHFLPFQVRGLSLCQWPGRFQRLEEGKKVTWFLDGAHTPDSLAVALSWFQSSGGGAAESRTLRLLVFNVTGDRNAERLLQPFALAEYFDLAVFCPPEGNSEENWSALSEVDEEDKIEPCRRLARVWEELQSRSKGVCLASAEETRDYVGELAAGERRIRVEVLVTGSLHLVGSFLETLQPHRDQEGEEEI